MKCSLDEIILIKGTSKTARIIEIYAVREENDRLFAVKFPDMTTGYVFESQAIPLNNITDQQLLNDYRRNPLPISD